LQIGPAILKGERLPLPDRKTLPGPQPKCSDTLDKYIKLMHQCMDPAGGNRPGFAEVNARLNELAAAEVVAG